MSDMYDLSDEDEKKVLGEDLFDKLQAILEYVSDIPEMKTSIRNIDERLTRMENEFATFKYVVRGHSKDIEAEDRKWRQLAKSVTKIAA
jgi:hypothetical protein